MAKYSNNALRRAILVTLAYVPFSQFEVSSILKALRPCGYPDLTETTLMGQMRYLAEKGFVKIEEARNFITEREVTLVSITASGVDLLEGNRTDVGVDRA